MADEVVLNPGVGGAGISADDLGSNLFVQRVKCQFGEDGGATDVSNTNPMPVTSDAKDGTIVRFEDPDFVAGESPVAVDVDDQLGEPGKCFVVVCDGPGDLLVAHTNQTGGSPTYSNDLTLHEGDKLRVDGLQTDRIRLTHDGFTDTSYRVVASAGAACDLDSKTRRGRYQVVTGIDANAASSTASLDLRGLTHVAFGASFTGGTSWGTAVLTLEVSNDDATWLPTPHTITGALDASQAIAAVPVGFRHARVTVTTVEGASSTLTVQVGASA